MDLFYKLTLEIEAPIIKPPNLNFSNIYFPPPISQDDYYLKAFTKTNNEIGKIVPYNQLFGKDIEKKYNDFCSHLLNIYRFNSFSLINYLQIHNAYNIHDIRLILVHLHKCSYSEFYNELRLYLNDILKYLKLENDNNTKNESQQSSKRDTKKKLAFNEKDKLSDLIKHENSVGIVKNIKIQYNNIKGKELRILLKALQKLDLLPPKRIAAKFHRCCSNEFKWDIGTPQAMEEKTFVVGCFNKNTNPPKYIESSDEEDLKKMVEFLKTLIITN